MFLKAAVGFAACFGVFSFANGASCAGPQALEFQAHLHPDAATYTELGKWFGNQRQYSCAIEAFRAGLQLAPDSAELSYLLGLTLYTTGDSQAAIAPLQHAGVWQVHRG
jgi:Flp pilus assembly protein TadD